jgi:hypothetical protein
MTSDRLGGAKDTGDCPGDASSSLARSALSSRRLMSQLKRIDRKISKFDGRSIFDWLLPYGEQRDCVKKRECLDEQRKQTRLLLKRKGRG